MAEVLVENNEFLPLIQEAIKEAAIEVKAKKAESVNYPVDKINRNLWENLGDIDVDFKVSKKENINVIVSVNFDELKGVSISKMLTMFDKRVYVAAAALFNAGNETITLTQINYAMGNISKPAKYQIDKINESVIKMMRTVIYVDNSQEIERKYKYKKFLYNGNLFPAEMVSAIVNGQLTDAAIHLFREPPLITFARERRQVTTFEAKLFQSALSKTETNLAIEDYLLERIAAAKAAADRNDKVVINNILYETLYKETGMVTYKQKARVAGKIKTYFDYYIECGYIKSYKMEFDRITFYF